MKRGISILLVLLMCLTLFSACGKKSGDAPAQEQQPDDIGTGAAQSEAREPETVAQLSDYYGCWEDETGKRASMTIAPREEYGDVEVVIHWGVSAREMNEWTMHGALDAGSGILSYADGVKNRITWDDSLTDKTEPLRKGGSGTLTLADGGIRWADAEEPESASCAFARAEAELPAPRDLAEDYFEAIGEETSPERAACETLRYAYLIDALSQNSADMRTVLRFAWEGVGEEEREAFLTNFSVVVNLIDKAESDYESVRETFDAAGVGGEMKTLTESAYCRACWAALRSDTINMDSAG